MSEPAAAQVVAVAPGDAHRFTKPTRGGVVPPGDGIRVTLPSGAHEPLQAV